MAGRLTFRVMLAGVALAACCTHAAYVGLAPESPTGTPSAVATARSPRTSASALLRFDRLGYLPEERNKSAVAIGRAHVTGYRVVDASTKAAIGDGGAGPRTSELTSRGGTPIAARRIDLSMLDRPGRYMVELDENAPVGPIVVDDACYASVLPSVVHFLGAQRCGPTTVATSEHGACHLHASIVSASSGDAIAVDDGSVAPVTARSGPAVDVEGGWHDAGDYVKFVGTTAFVLTLDLIALRDHPAALRGPRAGGAYDGLRAEMRWGLDWLARMVGGAELYHQVSDARDHERGFRRPELDTRDPLVGLVQRPVFRFHKGRGANLLGRSAAAFALGAEVFADDPAYAAQLLALSRKTLQAGTIRRAVQGSAPRDFYPEESFEDDLALGTATLARVTGDRSLRDEALARARKLASDDGDPSPLSWGDVTALALLETARAYDVGSPERASMTSALERRADTIVAAAESGDGVASPYRYPMKTFGNGSVAEALGAAGVCIAAATLGSSRPYADVARQQVHWLFGQNPFGMSFMVGLGGAYPRHIHHGLAQAAELTLTGAIVGGPTSLATLASSRLRAPTTKGPFAEWSTNALLYDDNAENFVMNEPAIDFTAPLVFVMAALLDRP
jgi:hypothetical protein